MASDQPRRRQVGDETRARIDELADGWAVPAGAAPVNPLAPTESDFSAARRGEGTGRGAEPAGDTAPRRLRSGKALGSHPALQRLDDEEVVRFAPDATGELVPAPVRGTPRFDTDATGELVPAPVRGTPVAGARRALSVQVPVVRSRSGLWGDVHYLFASSRTLLQARREHAEFLHNLTQERTGRCERLKAMVREALDDAALDLPVLASGRERRAVIEEERARCRAALAAADAEIEERQQRVRGESERRTTRRTELSQQLERAREELVAIQRRSRVSRTAVARVRVSQRAVERRIAQASRPAGARRRAHDADPGAQAAVLAALHADREALVREELTLVAALGDLEPELVRRRSALRTLEERIAALDLEEREAQAALREWLAALEARKAVEQRQLAAADRACDELLGELGGALQRARPPALEVRLRGIEQHELAIEHLERRLVGLDDLRSSVDRGSMWRGAVWVLLAATGLAALVWTVLRLL
jgi:hypothetical protein